MAVQEAERTRPVDNRLLDPDSRVRLGYGLEVFRGIVGSERFGQVLDALGVKLLEAGFFRQTAGLILPENKFSAQGASLVFRPNDPKEKGEGMRHATVSSVKPGEADLAIYFPGDERVIGAGLVYWGIITGAEAEALRPLFMKGKPFLRLVVMDPSILNERDLRPFVQATHPDEPGLKPKTFIRLLASRFRGGAVYEASTGDGMVRVVRFERGAREVEDWLTIPPEGDEGFLLVGKKAK